MMASLIPLGAGWVEFLSLGIKETLKDFSGRPQILLPLCVVLDPPRHRHHIASSSFLKIILFILFFDCAGSLLLCELCSRGGDLGLLFCCRVRALGHTGFSSCDCQA